MAYLFLDVTEPSLRDGFKRISQRLKNSRLSFEEFIEYCFPNRNYYENENEYIVYPSAINLQYEGKGDSRYLRNIAIYSRYSRRNIYLRRILSENYAIVAIGDINVYKNSWCKFQVRSFEIIDVNCVPSSSNSISIVTTVIQAFKNANWGKGSDFAIRGVDFSDTVINSELIDRLFELKPVKDIESVKRKIDQWEKYLDFREKWSQITTQQWKQELVDCKIVEAYTISDSEYNKDKHEINLLDGKEEFAPKGNKSNDNYVYLKKHVAGSEKVRLLKLTLEKNKIEAEKEKWRKLVNRLLKDQLKLEKESNGKQKDNKRPDESIGDGKEVLIRAIFSDVEPDCSEIENEYNKQILSAKEQIEDNYHSILEQNVSKYKREKESEILAFLQKTLAETEENLEIQYAVKLEQRNDPRAEKEIKNRIQDSENKDSNAIDESIAQEVYAKMCEEQKKIFRSLQENEYERQLKDAEKSFRKVEEDRLREYKENEIIATENNLNEEKRSKIDEKNAKETLLRAEIYIYLDENVGLDEKNIGSYKFLSYDNYLEAIKLKRQKESLEALKNGKFKNPMLTSFLFKPEDLPEVYMETVYDEETDSFKFKEEMGIEWENSRLNDVQKESVVKALNASGIFMLQGPPGTGKTTVIAELAAQFVKRGERVLIASETHKAIDNAFEEIDKLRLPQVHLLRLFAVGNRKADECQWQYKNLTENLYSHIKERLSKSTENYRHFTERRKKFDEELAEMKQRLSSINSLRERTQEILKDRDDLSRRRQKCRASIIDLDAKIAGFDYEFSLWKGCLNVVNSFLAEGCEMPETDAHKAQIMAGEFRNKMREVLAGCDCLIGKPYEIAKANITQVEADIVRLQRPDRIPEIEVELASIRIRMGELEDDGKKDTDECKSLQERRIKLVNERNSLRNQGQTAPDLYIYKLVRKDAVNREGLVALIASVKEQLQNLQKDYADRCSAELDKIKDEKDGCHQNRDRLKNEIEQIAENIKAIDANDDNAKLKELEKEMKKEIMRYFSDFGIIGDYKNDYGEALRMIEGSWRQQLADHEQNASTIEARLGIMDDITKYINAGAVERDFDAINPEIAKLVNVFGMTSTGTDRIEELKGVNLKQDIDVVIIDEVSKSSFLDLIRPILYGKKVILVGDHLQLPPMYDLKHLREEDLEDVPEDIITIAENRQYTEMMEECLFERLYNAAPESYKIMLNRQYRFHSHIMNANPFYGNALELGTKDQDARKEHNMTIKGLRGRPIITPDKHLCFIDCGKSYESCPENSNSLINNGEAEVVMELLKQIGQNRGKGNPLSVGVICTYGRQAKKIKDAMKRSSGIRTGLNEGCNDEKFVVSTVDDFQGDERDVIILSMVRNPRPGRRYSLDFIRAFQRINVAITRPRKLLIVVGASDFLCDKALVDFTTADGVQHKNESIFSKIRKQAVDCDALFYMDDIIEPKNE